MTLGMKPRVAIAMMFLVVVIAVLHWSARFGLRGPDSFSTDGFDRWTDDPATALATVVRWLALVLSYYLLVVVAIVGLTDDSPERRGVRRLIPPGLAATAGVLLGTSAVVVPMAAHMANTAPARSGGLTSPATEEQVGEFTLRLVAPEDSLQLTPIDPADADDSERPPAVSDPSTKSTDATDLVDSPDLWHVELGDHFWSIAEETLVDHWGRSDISDGDVAGYWRTVIAANEDRLVEPGNPDLILPGQVLVLPQPPNDPAAA